MSALFISFVKNITKKNAFGGDFYRDSLEDQYELLKLRIPPERRIESLEQFIEATFTTGLEKAYYFSCPNFLRELRSENEGAISFLDNVVIRPELTLSMRRCLPDGQNVILVGNIAERGERADFTVKGIEFIDESMFAPGDRRVKAAAINAFEMTSFVNSRTGKTVTVPLWKVSDWKSYENLLSPDFIKELIDSCFTVSNPLQVRQTYDQWQRYMEFRKYYLKEQAKRSFKLDRVLYLEA